MPRPVLRTDPGATDRGRRTQRRRPSSGHQTMTEETNVIHALRWWRRLRRLAESRLDPAIARRSAAAADPSRSLCRRSRRSRGAVARRVARGRHALPSRPICGSSASLSWRSPTSSPLRTANRAARIHRSRWAATASRSGRSPTPSRARPGPDLEAGQRCRAVRDSAAAAVASPFQTVEARRPSSPVGGAPGPSRWPDGAFDFCSPMRPQVSMTSSGLPLPVAGTAELG